MPRKTQLEIIRLSARVPRGYEWYWSVIRELDHKGPWSIPEVRGYTNVRNKDSVRDYVSRLVRAGFAAHVDTVKTLDNGVPTKLYRLLKRPSTAPSLRRDGRELGLSAQQRMWTAIRSMKRGFGASELAYAAGDTSGAVPTITTKRFVAHLVTAGYLTSDGAGFYRLKPSMNTGPAAPKILRTHVVWDSNRNKVIGDAVVDAEEVA